MQLLAMVPKLTPFSLFRRITVLVCRSRPFYSTSSSDSARIRAETKLIALKSNEFESAIVFLKKELHADALVRVLDSVSDPRLATAIFRWSSGQRNFQQTAQTYAHMIWKLGIAGDLEEVESFLREMVKIYSFDNESSVGLLIESFCANQRTREALKVFEIARSANLRVLLSTCNILLRDLVSKSGNFDSVMFVYKEMVKAEILPDVDTLNYLIKGLCEAGMLDSALSQFWRMKQKHCIPNSWTFELIIVGLCCGGRVDEAVGIWRQMLKAECHPHHEFYARIIPLLCGANKVEEGIELFKMMKNDGISPDLYLYSALIEGLTENILLNDAVELFEEMTDLGISPSGSSYVHIVNGYCKLGKLDEAMKFLDATDCYLVEPYDALLSHFSGLGRFPEAINLLEEILEKGVGHSLSWNIIISELCRKGDVRKALEVICRMIVSDYLPDNISYSSLIAGYCGSADFEKAFQIFKLAFVQDLNLNTGCSSELIEGLCYAKKVQEAFEVFNHISCRGCSSNINSLNVLVKEICDTGKVEDAIKLRILVSHSGSCFSSSTYLPIMAALLELNNERHALPLLAQMLVEGCTLDMKTYCLVIYGLSIGGRSRVAADLFNKMVDDGIIPGSEKLENLILGFARCSGLQLVSQSLEKVVEGGSMLSPLICNVIISCLLKEGHKPVASKFMNWMLEKGWLPDPDTHCLFFGNADSEAGVRTIKVYDVDNDKVGNILAEGLENSV